ncbi:MAG: Fur family transcriptional regulator [Bacteriovoracia bacterium]
MKVKPCKHHAHDEPAMKRLDWAIGQIREKSLRVTTQRKNMLAALLKSDRPLSAEEVFDRLKKGTSDLTTVFRSLGDLEAAGLLRRHEFGDGLRRYEVVQEKGHHHHFIHCRSCGNVEAFDGCDFEKVLSKSLERRGYKKIQHNLEVMALCSACA